jgi:hypothetical protein
MFRKIFVIAVFGGSAFAAMASGCGGSSDVKDAGMDATLVDTGPDTTTSDVKDAGCNSDADLGNIDFGDASWPADSGIDGSSPEACWLCLKLSCSTVLTKCNADCDCKKAFSQVFECVRTMGLQQACGAPLLMLQDISYATDFLGCAAGCLQACPVPIPGDGGGADSGPNDSGGG